MNSLRRRDFDLDKWLSKNNLTNKDKLGQNFTDFDKLFTLALDYLRDTTGSLDVGHALMIVNLMVENKLHNAINFQKRPPPSLPLVPFSHDKLR